MIDISQEQRITIQKILEKFIPNTPVWAFGSRVHGTAKSYSDLDLVIVGSERIPVKIYYQLQDAFEESTLPYRVDLLDWHRISTAFQKVIKQEYVLFS